MNKTSVLLVDDDHDFREFVATLLRARSYTVDAVERGDQLLARLTSGAALPSVILMDVLLPDSDGIELIGQMKKIGIDLPVIMLSGAGHVRTVVEAMKLGACDFLLKPFDESALEQAIEAAVESFSARQQQTVSAAGVGRTIRGVHHPKSSNATAR